MGSISKDRISNLPDDIIGYILSFLHTNQAVASSILSKRWMHAWYFITTLDLDDKYMNLDNPLRTTSPSIVYRVLLLLKASSLRKFRLYFRKDYQASDVNSWIDYALRCNVEHLDISASLEDKFSPVSLKVFSSTTLTILKLNVDFVMNIPFSICLLSLKVIHLVRVQFPDSDSFTRFLCGCPVVEEFYVRNFRGGSLLVINIAAPLLKRLILYEIGFDSQSGDYDDMGYKIIINAPSLVYLDIEDCYADLYSIIDSPNLIEAHICFDEEVWTHVEGVADFFKGISSVQSLYLRWYGLKSMMMGLVTEGHYNLPIFSRLKDLEICVDKERDFLADFLQNSPHLESLKYSELSESNLGQRKFKCQMISTNLKVVHIDASVGLKGCADMINYFLKKSKSLEKLIIDTENPRGVEQDLRMVNYFRKNNNEEVMKMNVEYKYKHHRVLWTLHYANQSRYKRYYKITKK